MEKCDAPSAAAAETTVADALNQTGQELAEGLEMVRSLQKRQLVMLALPKK